MAKFKRLPSVENLRMYLQYDEESGGLVWIKTSRHLNRKQGERAGTTCWYGYRHISFQSQSYCEHRLVWLLHTGEDPGDRVVDHKDHNRSNNRIDNLRIGDHQDNNRNSACIGVGWHTSARKWRAYITVDRKDIHLGLFVELEDAVKARLQAEIHHFGEWAPTCYEDFDEEVKARMERLADLKRKLKDKSKGVSLDSSTHMWSAYIYYEGKSHWLGRHRTKTEALMARRQAEIRFGLATEIESSLLARFNRISTVPSPTKDELRERVTGVTWEPRRNRWVVRLPQQSGCFGYFSEKDAAVAALVSEKEKLGLL